MEKLQAFLVSPFSGDKKLWQRILLGLAVAIPWIVLFVVIFLTKGNLNFFKDLLSIHKTSVDKEIDRIEEEDKELEKEQDKYLTGAAKAKEERESTYEEFYKEQDDLDNANSADELNDIRDRLNNRVKQKYYREDK